MLIDCDSCVVRGLACGDCVVTVMLGAPPGAIEVDGEEQSALDALARSGLVPRLQMTPPSSAGGEGSLGSTGNAGVGYRPTGTAP
jgi:hypothetical protein